MMRPQPTRSDSGLRRSTRLQPFQWVVLVISILATAFAANLVSNRSEAQTETEFQAEASRTVDLIVDRLERYEVGLWAGVGLIEAISDDETLSRDDWIRFADNLDLVGKYPGINGIGVIHRVEHDNVEDYIATFAPEYPEIDDFAPKPYVEADEHFPITFIEPFIGNEAAVGLDMTFEANRLAGAQAAFRSGTAQITGPIVLVQDEEQTPGFLFFAPFDENIADVGSGGLVYAPFVARRLMAGALIASQRDVSISITDGDTVLYSEFNDEFTGYDSDPVFTRKFDVDLYGRTWNFDVASNTAFRARSANNEPEIILVAGLILNALLLMVFVNSARARKRTLDYADDVTVELRHTLAKLEDTNVSLSLTNQDLEQFAFVASHDLQTPMRTVSNYASLLHEELDGQIDDDHIRYLESLISASDRMQVMIRSILDYSTLARSEISEPVDLTEILAEVLGEVDDDVSSLDARIDVDPLPVVAGSRDGLAIVFRNLIVNALKYRRDGIAPVVSITSESDGDVSRVSVSDNGIGIDAGQRAKIFQIFYRLNPTTKYDGTGIGLAMCKRIVDSLGGNIEVDDNADGGTTFTVVLPVEQRPAGMSKLSPERDLQAVR